MFHFLISLYKWFAFIVYFHINHKWLLNEYEGVLRLRKEFINLGILGLKLGQYLGSRNDIFSDEHKKVFEDFLSENPSHELSYTNFIINEEIDEIVSREKIYSNISLKQILPHLSLEPIVLGSGSVAQAYRCTINETTPCVLKVLHPQSVELGGEVQAVKYVLKILTTFVKTLINVDWDDFFQSILDQCDLKNEAENMEKFYNIFKDHPMIETPEPMYWSKKFLIMSFCEGKPIVKIDRKSDIYENASRHVCSSYIYSILKNNCGHGDLHPGNVLVKPNGKIAILDYGICLRADDIDMKSFLRSWFKSIISFNYEDLYIVFGFLIKDYDKFNRKINFDTVVIKWIEYYKDKNEANIQNAKTKTGMDFNLIMKELSAFIRINNYIIKGFCFTALLQFFILENYINDNGLGYGKCYMINIFSFMKHNQYYVDNLGYIIHQLYESQIPVTHPDVLDLFP
jgi:predicted unusual protein kinase regulating ubiquinone biosynthesis (AarF/ABC1/UbiB family)